MLKLVETCTGVGELTSRYGVFPGVRYRISRFQGMARSGLPIPGLHRIEGNLDLAGITESDALVGTDLTLLCEDGRAMQVTLLAADGSVLAEGHGPSRCSCC